MISLLNYEPEKRPTLTMLHIHPWVIKKHKVIKKDSIKNVEKIKKLHEDGYKQRTRKPAQIKIEELPTERTKIDEHKIQIVEGSFGNLYWGSPVKV